MIRTGDVLQNPVTGETVYVVRSAADTGGEYVAVEVRVEPDGFVAATHVHPYQTEVFEILEGEVGFKAGGKTIVAGPGETVVVEPGTAHRFWNNGDVPARFRCEVRPALQFEQLLATMYALAADGKTNRKGMPMNPFRLAVIAGAHFDTVRLPFPPAWLQAAGLAVGSPLGRMLGYQATYAPEQVVPTQPAIA